MKKILVWETLSLVAGGQKMTLSVMDLLKDEYSFYCLLPEKGPLADELDNRGIPYFLMGNQTMPTGVKGKSVVIKYAWLSLKAVLKGIAVILRQKPCLIYAPGPAALPWSAICGSITNKRVIWHLHHIFADGPTKKLLNFFGRQKSVIRIIAVSDYVKSQIAAPNAAKKAVTLYNPVDYNKYASGDKTRILNELKGLGISGEETLIAVIGLLQEQKRQDKAIELVDELIHCGVNAKLLIIGAPRPKDAYVEKVLHALVRQKELEDRVFFLGKREDVEDILQILSAVLVLSNEGLSLVALEAMSAGVPVFTVSDGGAAELVNASGGGAVYEAHTDIHEMAQKLLGVISDSAVIKNGRQFAQKQTLDGYRENLSDLFG